MSTNGQAQRPISEQIQENRQKIRLARSKIQLARYEQTAKLMEAGAVYGGGYDWVTMYGDILNRYWAREPYPSGLMSTYQDRRYGKDFPIFQTEQELAILRMPARILLSSNSYAIGLAEGLTSYVIGSGFKYLAAARQNKDAPRELLDAVQKVIEDFLKLNSWHGEESPGLEEELFWRSMEDGEFLVVTFPQEDGTFPIRTVEPEQLTIPLGANWEEWSFGIKSRIYEDGAVDSQVAEAYHIFWGHTPAEGSEYAPDRVVHFRRNVKRSIKRGLPDFSFDTHERLSLASKLCRNMAAGATTQAAIGGIRQHKNQLQSQVQSYIDSQLNDFQKVNPITGNTDTFTRFEPGQFLDIDDGQEWKDPPGAANAEGHIAIMQAALRGAGVRWNAPEWLGSADASQTNFASSLTAESPFVKTGKRRQGHYKAPFLRLINMAVEHWIQTNGLRVESKDGDLTTEKTYTWDEVKRLVEIQCEPPSLEARNRIEEANVNQILKQNRILSPQTWSAREDLEYDHEQTNIVDDAEHYGQEGQGLQLPGMGGDTGGMGGEEPPETGNTGLVREGRLLEGDWNEKDHPRVTGGEHGGEFGKGGGGDGASGSDSSKEKRHEELKDKVIIHGGHALTPQEKDELAALDKDLRKKKSQELIAKAEKQNIPKLAGADRSIFTVGGEKFWGHIRKNAPNGKNFSADNGKTWQTSSGAAVAKAKDEGNEVTPVQDETSFTPEKSAKSIQDLKTATSDSMKKAIAAAEKAHPNDMKKQLAIVADEMTKQIDKTNEFFAGLQASVKTIKDAQAIAKALGKSSITGSKEKIIMDLHAKIVSLISSMARPFA